MNIKECFVSYNGISCINQNTNLIDFSRVKNYINGYFLIKLLEIIIINTIENKNELKEINFSTSFIDF